MRPTTPTAPCILLDHKNMPKTKPLPEGLKWVEHHGRDAILLDVMGHRMYYKPTVWGSAENARRAAINRLAEIERGLHDDATGRMARANTESGVAGVRAQNIGPNKQRTWIAEWPDPVTKKVVRRKFSVRRYGEEKARQLALEARLNRAK